jgi:hypothetical protein
MAGKKPFFITGATAKIKVNDLNLAFCTNVSYSVTVNHATPRVLGMFEPTSVEPLSYLVTGSFSVIRYAADAVSGIGAGINGVERSGNGIGSWTQDSPTSLNLLSNDGRAHQNLNPKYLDKATGFEIYIYQKISGSQISVARIKEARITRADFSMNKKSPATQNFQFTALYADEDSFLADFSGLGQQFQ